MGVATAAVEATLALRNGPTAALAAFVNLGIVATVVSVIDLRARQLSNGLVLHLVSQHPRPHRQGLPSRRGVGL